MGKRFWEVDTARGLALGMMVLYHLVFDLEAYAGYRLDARRGFWADFADTTAATFIFLAGLSLPLSYARLAARRGTGCGLFPVFLRRGLTILGWGLLLTLVTLLLSPTHAILFGILHYIGASIPLAYSFVRFRVPNPALAALGVACLVVGRALGEVSVDHQWLLWLGLRPAGYAALDYRPLLPGFGVTLLGICLGNFLYGRGDRRFPLPDLSRLAPITFLSFLGRHSLAIYLVHQPILIAHLILFGVIDPAVFLPG